MKTAEEIAGRLTPAARRWIFRSVQGGDGHIVASSRMDASIKYGLVRNGVIYGGSARVVMTRVGLAVRAIIQKDQANAG